MKHIIIIIAFVSSFLFTGCAGALFEGILGAAIEETVAASAARGVAMNVARRTVTRSVARAGIGMAARSAGGAATAYVANEALANACLSRMVLGAGAMLIIPLDDENNTKLKAKAINHNTIQVNGEYFSLPGSIYVVNTANLNVRSGPSTDYGVVSTLSKKKVVFVEEITTNGWAKVHFGYNQSGYMSKRYLSAVR